MKVLQATSGFMQLGQDQQFFSFSSLPIIGYGLDRVLCIISFLKYKFRFLIYIQAGADTAPNTQAA
jgi:hypothetical protein